VCINCGDHKGLSNCFCGWKDFKEPEYKEITWNTDGIKEDYAEYCAEMIADGETPMKPERWLEKLNEEQAQAIYEMIHDL